MDSSFEYYEVSFWVSFLWLFLKSIFGNMSIATLAFFPVYLLRKFVTSPSLSVCVGLLFLDVFLVGGICVSHDFLFIQLFYVFWLKHFILLCLRLLLIGTYSLPFFHTYIPLSLTLFLPFLKAVPLASVAELVWWRCILLDCFCLGSSLFGLPF